MRMLSDVLKEQYGEKIYKLSLTSGCTCPNRDGTLGYGGCTFCSEGGSGEFASAPGDIEEQIEEAKERICRKTDAKRFIAYFQAYTNTYGDIDRLSALYRKVIQREDIVILSLGTRPDCLDDSVLEMIRELNRIKPVWIELGLQTMHEATAERVHRGYRLQTFENALCRLKSMSVKVIVHVIFGLPGESTEEMLQTVRYLATLRPDGIKIQMLNILKGTELGRQYEAAPFQLLTMEEYTDLVVRSMQLLPEETVLHRMTGDGPGDLLIAPDWVRNKKKVLNTIRKKAAASAGE